MTTKRIHYLKDAPTNDFTYTLAPCGNRFRIYVNSDYFTPHKSYVTCKTCLKILNNKVRLSNAERQKRYRDKNKLVHFRLIKRAKARCGINLSLLKNSTQKSSHLIEKVTCKLCLKGLNLTSSMVSKRTTGDKSAPLTEVKTTPTAHSGTRTNGDLQLGTAIASLPNDSNESTN